MIKKVIFFGIYIILGIMYAPWGLAIERLLQNNRLGLNLRSFFVPLTIIDIVVGVIYLCVSKIARDDNKWRYLSKFIVYLFTAVCISVVSCFGGEMVRFVLTMNF